MCVVAALLPSPYLLRITILRSLVLCPCLLHVQVHAERPGEVNHTAKVLFHAGDDIEAIAAQFCVDHAISNPTEAARDIVQQVTNDDSDSYIILPRDFLLCS